ncbi:MAG TPA: hypothetical protein VF520_02215 [Thermoleophilaceae bacterium]
MTLDLHVLLADLDSPDLDLSARLERAKSSADRIWAQPRLHWFTDHSSTRHSRRIIQILGDLVAHLQNTSHALGRSELFVLLCAAYLHDIGMQDFRVDGRGPDDFDVEDYELIRTRHPARARELIVARALRLEATRDDFVIDLDDQLDYLLPTALVSEGHGSAFFEKVVAEFRAADYAPENQAFRGPLLTALLLIADELDLHEDRAAFPAEMDRSPVTALHHHVNHYVTRVTVVEGEHPRVRRVYVSLAYPQQSESYQDEVRGFITDKLARQARRVNPVLATESGGELSVDPVIHVRERTESFEAARRPLPPQALAHLRSELFEDALVGRKETIARLRFCITQSSPSEYELAVDPDSDLPMLMRWAEATAEAHGRHWVHVDFTLAVGTEKEDVFWRITEQASPPDAAGEPTAEGQPIPADSLATVATDSSHFQVWVLEGVDRLAEDVRAWLQVQLSEVAKVGVPLLVITVRSAQSPPVFLEAQQLHLGALTEEDVVTHLRDKFGYAPEECIADAQELIASSEGIPGRLLAGLAIRRRRNHTEVMA